MEVPSNPLLCPITLETFRDPVMAQDGHTYERKAIEKWIRENGTSPITKRQISLENLVPNHAIKKVIDQFENLLREKKFRYTLDVDVKKSGRPLFQTFGKTIYHAEWLPNNDGRQEIVLLKIDGAQANKEASFYADLSRHPHVVRTFGFVRDDDTDRNSVLLLQEYASEGSLFELLYGRRKTLDEKILVEMFLQIIDGMSYLASNNIVHGDLACRNVLVFRFHETDPRNIVVKVTDFGLSRYSKIYAQVATGARSVLNVIPVRYSAPEILARNVTANDCTEKSDVYAMGVLMWEAYSKGAIPWTNIPSDDDVIQRVRNGDVLPRPADCSPQYWSIIIKTWNRLPNQRPTFDELKKLFRNQLYQTATAAPQSRLPSYCQENRQSFFRQAATSATGAVDVVDEAGDMDLVGQTVALGNHKYLIKKRIVCHGQELCALECDRAMVGYDGLCPACDKQHVHFAGRNRGFYAPVKDIRAEVYRDRLAAKRS